VVASRLVRARHRQLHMSRIARRTRGRILAIRWRLVAASLRTPVWDYGFELSTMARDIIEPASPSHVGAVSSAASLEVFVVL
jgi:hypothetical protein